MHENLKEAVLNDELIIFIGAGVSIPFGFPNWTNLVISILEDLKIEGPARGIDLDHFIKQGKEGLLNVFEVLDDLERKGFKQKVKELLYSKIKYKNNKLGEKYFSRIEKLWNLSDKIITTNYDKVLEEKKPREVEAFTNSNKFQQAESLKGNSFLYKIHGDITNPDNCILFNSDYENLYKEDSSNRRTLQAFISTKTILFIGFSFEDKFVQSQFEYIKELYNGYGKEHFIVLTENKDLSKFGLKTQKIDNWGDSCDDFLDELISLKASKKKEIKEDEITEIDISTINDISHLEELLEAKKEEFENASENEKREASKKMHHISHRIRELLLKKLDLTNAVITDKETGLEFIFDEIFTSEKISKSTLSKINEIRDLHSKEYHWYHRSLIVSALACSLINHKKPDPKKIDLLIDFTADTEDKVWEKAITYLFIVLNHLGNKWLRYLSLKPKLESLKSQKRIQDALKSIIALTQLNLHQNYFNMEMIFENEYFKKSPFNYFLPFYEDNPSIDKIYDDDSIEDIESYIDFLQENPFPDSLKYLMCNKEKEIKPTKKSEITESKRSFLNNLIHTHVAFNPYINYVNEFISFYKCFPDIEVEIKEKTDVIAFKNLKNSLLSNIEGDRAVARSFMLDKKYDTAITHLKSLVAIEEKDIDALNNLANCYSELKNRKEELKVRLVLIELEVESHYNHGRIGEIYYQDKKYKESLEYSNKAISLKEEGVYYEIRGYANYELKKYKESLKDLDTAINLGIDTRSVYGEIVNIKSELEDYVGAIEYCTKALDKSETNETKSDAFDTRGDLYRSQENFDKAIDDIEKALSLDNSFNSNLVMGKIQHDLGNYEEALEYFTLALSKSKGNKEKSQVLRFKGTMYRRDDLFDEAFEVIQKALSLEDSYLNNLEMGYLKDDLEDYEEAIKYCDIALEKTDEENKKNTALSYKANIFRKQNKYKKALHLLDPVLKDCKENFKIKKSTKGDVYEVFASVYSDMGKEENFYKFIEKAFKNKAKAKWIDDDILEKYKDEERFKELLKKYNQKL